MTTYPTGKLTAARLKYDEGYDLMMAFEIVNGPPGLIGRTVKLHCKPLDEVLIDIEGVDVGDDDEEDDEEGGGWDDILEDE